MATPAYVFLSASSAILLCVPPIAAEEFADSDLEFFERKIRPVLVEKCHQCHSVSAEKLKGNLYLDTRGGLLKGGDTGPAIVPGKPDQSLLVELIHYQDPDMEMPPKSKLPDPVIADFETWIKSGAAWPDEPAPTANEGALPTFDLEKRRSEHWSWKPLDPAPRTENFIDQLIRAGLAKAKITPAPPADPLTLLRRLTFDLTGLPPTLEEIESFQNSSISNPKSAIEEAVDRLLGSPHFGERWARHWLDLMRYAETHGHEFDYPIHHAHQYRDYVIRALNTDVPYDQFVTEHIAGDLLESPRLNPDDKTNESILATAFWYLGEAVHAPTDVAGDEADRIDNMIDVFSKSFLGLTVSCARCHDHKFDAISTADYYALTGYLQSTRRAEYKQDPSQKIAAALQEIAAIESEANPAGRTTPTVPPVADSSLDLILPSTLPWFPSGPAFANSPTPALTWQPVPNTTTEHATFDSARYGEKLHGTLRTPSFELTTDRVHLYVRGDAKVRLYIDGYFMEPFNGLLFGGTRKDIKTGGKWQWVTLNGKALDTAKGHNAYLEITDPGHGSIAVKALFTGHDAPDIQTILPPNPKAEDLQNHADRHLVNQSKKTKKIADAIPAPGPTFLAVAQGTPESAQIHIRGSHKNLGEAIPPRFLTALGGGNEKVSPLQKLPTRLDLASQVVSKDNPLSTRVAANRIWHHLFGRGIVPTTADFGPMGIPPSNPKLLDTLAVSLVENRWSQKALIREIVLSETYRQSAAPHPDNSPRHLADTDPENILLHKSPVRRLQAEAIRDSMLTISGRLDPKLYGSPVPVYLTSFMQGRGRPGSGPLDGNGRRSIYTSIRRNFLPPMMLAFDMPSPFSTMARRTVSNVPAQALTLMNDPFVIAESKRWAESTNGESDPAQRIQKMFLQAFTRTPSPEERAAILTFIETHLDPQQAWQDLAHTFWNKKEFIFLN